MSCPPVASSKRLPLRVGLACLALSVLGRKTLCRDMIGKNYLIRIDPAISLERE
jgi:hypothetical protein